MAKDVIIDRLKSWGDPFEKESPAPAYSPLDFQEPWNTDLALPDNERKEKEVFKVKEYGFPMAIAWDIPDQVIKVGSRVKVNSYSVMVNNYGKIMPAKTEDIRDNNRQGIVVSILKPGEIDRITGHRNFTKEDIYVTEERHNVRWLTYLDELELIEEQALSWDIPVEKPDAILLKGVDPEVKIPVYGYEIFTSELEDHGTVIWAFWMSTPEEAREEYFRNPIPEIRKALEECYRLYHNWMGFDDISEHLHDKYHIELNNEFGWMEGVFCRVVGKGEALSWNITVRELGQFEIGDRIMWMKNATSWGARGECHVEKGSKGTVVSEGAGADHVGVEWDNQPKYRDVYSNGLRICWQALKHEIMNIEGMSEDEQTKLFAFESVAANDAAVERFIKEAKPGQIWRGRSGFLLILSPNHPVEYERKNDNKLILRNAVWSNPENKSDVDPDQDFGVTIVDEKYDFPLRQQGLMEGRSIFAWDLPPTKLPTYNDPPEDWLGWLCKRDFDNYYCIIQGLKPLSELDSFVWYQISATVGYNRTEAKQSQNVEIFKGYLTWLKPIRYVGVLEKLTWDIPPADIANTIEELISLAQVGDVWLTSDGDYEYRVLYTPIKVVKHISSPGKYYQRGGEWKHKRGIPGDGPFEVKKDFPMKLISRKDESTLTWDIPEQKIEVGDKAKLNLDTMKEIEIYDINDFDKNEFEVMSIDPDESGNIQWDLKPNEIDSWGKGEIWLGGFDKVGNDISIVLPLEHWNRYLEIIKPTISRDISSNVLSWAEFWSVVKVGDIWELDTKDNVIQYIRVDFKDNAKVTFRAFATMEDLKANGMGIPFPNGYEMNGDDFIFIENINDSKMAWDIPEQPYIGWDKFRQTCIVGDVWRIKHTGDSYASDDLCIITEKNPNYIGTKDLKSDIINPIEITKALEDNGTTIFRKTRANIFRNCKTFQFIDHIDIDTEVTASKEKKFEDEIFIYLSLPKSVRKRFSHISNLDQDLHMTLICVKDKKLTNEEKKKIVKEVQKVAKQYVKVKCKFTGLGTFDNGDDTVAALVNCIEGSELYQKCLEAVESIIGEFDRKFGYLPHVTLKYEGNGKANLKDLKPFSWTAKEICCKFSDDEMYKVSLKSGKVEEKISRMSWDVPLLDQEMDDKGINSVINGSTSDLWDLQRILTKRIDNSNNPSDDEIHLREEIELEIDRRKGFYFSWDIPTFINNIEELIKVATPGQIWEHEIDPTNEQEAKYLFINSNLEWDPDCPGSVVGGVWSVERTKIPRKGVNCFIIDETSFPLWLVETKEASIKVATPESYTDRSDIDMTKDEFDQRALFLRQEDHLDMRMPEDWLPGENDYKYFAPSKIHQDIDDNPPYADVSRISNLRFEGKEIKEDRVYINDHDKIVLAALKEIQDPGKVSWDIPISDVGFIANNLEEFLSIAGQGQVWQILKPEPMHLPFVYLGNGFRTGHDGNVLRAKNSLYSWFADESRLKESISFNMKDSPGCSLNALSYPVKLIRDNVLLNEEKQSWDIPTYEGETVNTQEEFIVIAKPNQVWKNDKGYLYLGDTYDYIKSDVCFRLIGSIYFEMNSDLIRNYKPGCFAYLSNYNLPITLVKDKILFNEVIKEHDVEASEEYDSILDPQPEEVVRRNPTDQKEQQDPERKRLDKDKADMWYERGLHRSPDNVNDMRPLMPYGSKLSWDIGPSIGDRLYSHEELKEKVRGGQVWKDKYDEYLYIKSYPNPVIISNMDYFKSHDLSLRSSGWFSLQNNENFKAIDLFSRVRVLDTDYPMELIQMEDEKRTRYDKLSWDIKREFDPDDDEATYKFDELPWDMQDKVLGNYGYINVDYNWWEFTYEDAATIGLKITEFDIDRGSYCHGRLTTTMDDCIEKILENHGESTETYKLAVNYKRDLAELDSQLTDDNEYEINDKHDELHDSFVKDLCEEYLTMLRNEYDYLTSAEAIKETLKSNDYEFNNEGKIASDTLSWDIPDQDLKIGDIVLFDKGLSSLPYGYIVQIKPAIMNSKEKEYWCVWGDSPEEVKKKYNELTEKHFYSFEDFRSVCDSAATFSQRDIDNDKVDLVNYDNKLSWDIPVEPSVRIKDLLESIPKRNRWPKRAINNTKIFPTAENDGFIIQYHYTHILTFYGDRIIINNGGWATISTSDHINGWLRYYNVPGSVFTKNRETLYVANSDWEHPYRLDNRDRIEVGWDGVPIGPYEQLQPRQRRVRVEPVEPVNNQLDLGVTPDVDVAASLAWDLYQDDIEIGDRVEILSKSIGSDKAHAYVGTTGVVTAIKIMTKEDLIYFKNWCKPMPEVGDTIYTIYSSFFLRQDLELLKKASESSIDNDIKNIYIQSTIQGEDYGQNSEYSQYELFATPGSPEEKAKEFEFKTAQESQQSLSSEIPQDTQEVELDISYPTIEEIVELHNTIVAQYGGQPGIFPEGEGKLAAALGRMQSGMGDQEFYPTLVEKSAVLMHSIITTHPFLDGNKRTAFLAGVKFLHLHGISLEDSDGIAELIIEVAEGKMSYEQLRDWLKDYSSHYMEKHEDVLHRLSWDIPYLSGKLCRYTDMSGKLGDFGYVFLTATLTVPGRTCDVGFALWDKTYEGAKSLYEKYITPEIVNKMETFINEHPDYNTFDLHNILEKHTGDRLSGPFGYMSMEKIVEIDEPNETNKLSWDLVEFNVGDSVKILSKSVGNKDVAFMDRVVGSVGKITGIFNNSKEFNKFYITRFPNGILKDDIDESIYEVFVSRAGSLFCLEKDMELSNEVLSWNIPDLRYRKTSFEAGDRVKLNQDVFSNVGSSEIILDKGSEGTLLKKCENPFYWYVILSNYVHLKDSWPIYVGDLELI